MIFGFDAIFRRLTRGMRQCGGVYQGVYENEKYQVTVELFD